MPSRPDRSIIRHTQARTAVLGSAALIVALAAVLPLTGCGGGGSTAAPAASNPPPSPPPPPPPPPPPSASGACSTFYGSSFTLARADRGPGTVPPALARPTRGQATAEPSWGTCLVRAADTAADYPAGTFMRNDYSRRQAFNADSSLYLTYSLDGFWHVYNATSHAYVRRLAGPAGDAEPQWHPSDPNTLYYLPTNGGTVIHALDVRNNGSRVAADLRAALPAWAANAQHIWTKSEGSPSADGRYWGLQVEDAGFRLLGYIVWDMQAGRLVGSRQSTQRPDHSSMSASGRWYVTSSDDEGTWAWSPDFTQKKKLHNRSEHSDLALGPAGQDMYVAVDYQSNAGDVFFADIDACPSVPASAATAPLCPRTVLFANYSNGSATALHVSGKAFDKPGWVLISTYGTSLDRAGGLPWWANMIFAMELRAGAVPYALAHHRSAQPTSDAYFFEPHATVNRSFTRIQFSSGWGSTQQQDLQPYQVHLPATALPLAP